MKGKERRGGKKRKEKQRKEKKRKAKNLFLQSWENKRHRLTFERDQKVLFV